MGDDAGNGEWIINMPGDSTVKELVDAIIHGGYGNDWPIPHTGGDNYWEIQTNVGTLAYLSGDKKRSYYPTFNMDTPLKETGITSTFGARPDNEDISEIIPLIE